jgi:hypothetical protein
VFFFCYFMNDFIFILLRPLPKCQLSLIMNVMHGEGRVVKGSFVPDGLE